MRLSRSHCADDDGTVRVARLGSARRRGERLVPCNLVMARSSATDEPGTWATVRYSWYLGSDSASLYQ